MPPLAIPNRDVSSLYGSRAGKDRVLIIPSSTKMVSSGIESIIVINIQEGSIAPDFGSSFNCFVKPSLVFVQFLLRSTSLFLVDFDFRFWPPLFSRIGMRAAIVSFISALTAISVGKFFPISQSR